MKRRPILFRGALVLALLATVLAFDQTRRWRNASTSTAIVKREEAALRARIAPAGEALVAEQQRLTGIEADNARMIAEIKSGVLTQRLRATRPRLAAAEIDTRFKLAQRLEQDGDLAHALTDYLWCYDVGFMRTRDLLGRVAKLGEQFPAVRDALRQRALEAERRMLAAVDDYDAPVDLIAINRALKEEVRTLEVFDHLPEADPRRKDFGRGLFETFVTMQRYPDALKVVTAEQWFQGLESGIRLEETRASRERAQREAMANQPASEVKMAAQELARQRAVEAQRKATITSAALGVEILAGAGDVTRAHSLAVRLLSFDNSAEVHALLQQHLTRAGHADLLENETVRAEAR